jgi:hypothetical protein
VRDKTVIRAKSLEVKLAAANGKLQVVFGECVLDVGDAPVAAEALERPASAVAVAEEPVGLAVSAPGAKSKGGARSSVRPPDAAPRQPNGEGGSTPPPAAPPEGELTR